MGSELSLYSGLLAEIKQRVQQAQTRAALSANAEMIAMYWDIGRMIHQRQQLEGWGKGIIPRLASDMRNELPEVKGFSERNIGYMIRFFREYGEPPFLQQPAAKFEAEQNHPISTISTQLAFGIPWFHHVILIEKIKHIPTRLWYMEQTIEQGWSRDTLAAKIRRKAHERQGQAVSNFSDRLPSPQSELARQLLKDPYLFDFLTIEEPFHERELETGLVRHLEKFLLELGQGFAFVGRQYTLRDIHKPIGISAYELTRALPDNLKSSLPTVEEIEAELAQEVGE